jgi:hypothetical protein
MSGKMGVFGFLIGLALACALFGGTMLIIVGGMLPTIVSLMTDRTPQKSGAIAISVLNFAGVLPFVITVWNAGGTTTDAVKVMAQPMNWLVMFGMAGVGWFIYNYVPKMVSTFVASRAQAGIQARQDLQRALIDRWGPRVTSDKPIYELEKE